MSDMHNSSTSRGRISPARVPSRAKLIPTVSPWHERNGPSEVATNANGDGKSHKTNRRSWDRIEGQVVGAVRSVGAVSVSNSADVASILSANFRIKSPYLSEANRKTVETVETLEMDAPKPNSRAVSACYCCGRGRWWRSIYGPHLICAGCHPPAVPSVVAAWIPDIEPRVSSLSKG